MAWGAIIGAGASLLGGILGSKSEKKAIAAQNAYNHPSAIRERYESAGFSPLLGIAPGVDTQNGIGNPSLMGQGIANAGLALADGMDKAQMIKIEKAKLAQDQQKLDVLIQNATIRPRSGGVYAGNVSSPSVGGVGKKPKTVSDNGYTLTVHGENELLTPEATNPYPLGGSTPTLIDPRRPNAEAGSDRYGDVAEEIAGAGNFIADRMFNEKMLPFVKRYGAQAAKAVTDLIAKNPSMSDEDAMKKVSAGLPPQNVKPKKSPTEARKKALSTPLSERPYKGRSYKNLQNQKGF